MKEQIQPFNKKENWDANIDVYQNADLIVQTTNKCSKGCEDCYTASLGPKNELNNEQYESKISKLKEGNLIALRGGEITMIKDWFERFIIPALDKKLKIILETNGYFIGTAEYDEILKKIANDNIFTRVSFDLVHLKKGKEEAEFNNMATFAKDAEENKINFGFYSLGMDMNQIKDFINGTSLEPYFEKFHSLVKYKKILEIELKGKYLKADGNLLDNIEG